MFERKLIQNKWFLFYEQGDNILSSGYLSNILTRLSEIPSPKKNNKYLVYVQVKNDVKNF